MSFKLIKDLIYEAQKISLGNEMLEWYKDKTPMNEEQIVSGWAEFEYIDESVSIKAFNFLKESNLIFNVNEKYYSSSKKHIKLLKESKVNK